MGLQESPSLPLCAAGCGKRPPLEIGLGPEHEEPDSRAVDVLADQILLEKLVDSRRMCEKLNSWKDMRR